MRCLVCKKELTEEDAVCSQCGFSAETPKFLSRRQCQTWISTVVVPYQKSWLQKMEEEKTKKEQREEETEKKGLTEERTLRRIQRDSSFCGTYGVNFSAFVKAGETVAYFGSDKMMKQEVSGWKNIVALAAGNGYILGLHRNGTVSAWGKNDVGQCNVDGWKRIVQIAAEGNVSVALDADGRIHMCGMTACIHLAVHWTKIQKIALGGMMLVGLCADGSVKVAGNESYSHVADWSKTVDIAAGDHYILAALADGHVAAAGHGIGSEYEAMKWHDIVRVQAKGSCSVGIDKNGKVWYVGIFPELKESAKVVQVVLGHSGDEAAVAVLEKRKIRVYRYDREGRSQLGR